MKEVLQSTLEKIFTENVTPEVVLASEEKGWNSDLWNLVAESGFGLAGVPEELGGAGACWDDLYGLMRLCGRFALPVPLPETILGNWLLGMSGLEGYDGALSIAASTSLTWQDGVLNGTLAQVPWGRYVTHVVAVAPAAGDDQSPQVVVLPVAAATSVVESTNIAGEARDDLQFQHCTPVALAPLASHLSADVLFRAAAMVRAAQIVGALEDVMGLASEYVNERVQFGRPIAKFQAVQHSLAVLAEHVGAARIAAQAAFAEAGADLAELPLMSAKICASEAASLGASTGHGVHGAIGFTHEYRLHLLTRRLWAWRSEYGSATYWSELLGNAICAGGAEQFWPTITSGSLEVSR